jgi:DNA-binding NarL/FixJ family response regulator
VGGVADGAEALEFSLEAAPDIVVMDISMPTSGLLAARRIRESVPGTSVLVLSRHREPAYVREAFAAGVSAYVLKQSPFRELTKAIEAVRQGSRYLDSGIADPVLPAATSPGRPLTDRERDVLRRAALGQANKDIAAALRIAVKTVEVHKANAMRKLSLKDRGELIRYAVHSGWLQDD